MSLAEFIRDMPKVELHVHLEGSIQPDTLLKLAQRNKVSLPVNTLEELHSWYTFRDFGHFVEIYKTISNCLCTPEDIELVAREFLAGQAAQNIVYSEVTFTALTHYQLNKLEFADQLAALNRARHWAEAELNITMGLIIDIPRKTASPEEGLMVAEWAITGKDNGVIALGLGGRETGNPASKFRQAFELAHAAGLPCVLHAGENAGAESIRDALGMPGVVRIGHGVRCLEDPALVAELRRNKTPLEICPSSNVRLGIVPERALAAHPWPKLLAEELFLTVNSDGPALFNTTLTQEYLLLSQTFGLDLEELEGLVLNGLRASLLPAPKRTELEARFRQGFTRLRHEYKLEPDPAFLTNRQNNPGKE
jgi:adenosine deaminase